MSVQTAVVDSNGKSAGNITLKSEVFDVVVKSKVVTAAVVSHESRQQSGTFSSKTRGEVRGGGKKPWKQKGTGRARAGSIRSPLWRKGGVVFGPKPRSMVVAIPKRVKQGALKMALTDKVKSGRLRVVNEIVLAEPKTKLMAALLKSWGVADQKVIVVLPAANANVSRAAANLKQVRVSSGAGLNVYDVVHADWVVATPEAVERIHEWAGAKS